MSALLRQRTVEVHNPRDGTFGSGSIIAPGLILTAAHVSCRQGPDGRPVLVRALEGGSTVEAQVIWHDAELDSALLQADRGNLGAGVPIVRWGELTCEHPGNRPLCTAVGFPKIMRRRFLRRSKEVMVSDPKVVHGHIDPTTASRTQRYAFEVDGPHGNESAMWRGMSGAGIFCEGLLVGLATQAPEDWQASLLIATPACWLLAAEGFAKTLSTATGRPARLQPADLRGLLDDPPDPRLSASYLLSAHAQVVPLTGMDEQSALLAQWCKSNRRVDVAAITGTGGVGKTRLASELLRRLTEEKSNLDPSVAWTGGFLSETPQRSDQYAALATANRPMLLVVDYAEARLNQVEELLTVLTQGWGTAHPVRILLLARDEGSWWPPFRRTHQGNTAMGTGLHVEVNDCVEPQTSVAAYEAARSSFKERIRTLKDAGIEDDWASATAPESKPKRLEANAMRPTRLSLHVTALADVLTEENPAFAEYGDPVNVLLAHEERYWHRIARARGLDDVFRRQPGLLPAMVATQSLLGASNRTSARAAITAGLEAHHRGLPEGAGPDAQLVDAVEAMLTALYPAAGGARWGTIGPDLLAGEVISEVEEVSDHQFIADVLQNPALEEKQRRQGLTVISRAADEQPALAASAAKAVASAPDMLLPLATLDVADQLGTRAALRWITEIKTAVEDRARGSAPDPALSRWATDMADQALSRLHTRTAAAAAITRTPPSDQPNWEDVEGEAQHVLSLLQDARSQAIQHGLNSGYRSCGSYRHIADVIVQLSWVNGANIDAAVVESVFQGRLQHLMDKPLVLGIANACYSIAGQPFDDQSTRALASAVDGVIALARRVRSSPSGPKPPTHGGPVGSGGSYMSLDDFLRLQSDRYGSRSGDQNS
ncbi:serine protease [Streptomyces lunalinharesii]